MIDSGCPYSPLSAWPVGDAFDPSPDEIDQPHEAARTVDQKRLATLAERSAHPPVERPVGQCVFRAQFAASEKVLEICLGTVGQTGSKARAENLQSEATGSFLSRVTGPQYERAEQNPPPWVAPPRRHLATYRREPRYLPLPSAGRA